jgi:hypothetical protein
MRRISVFLLAAAGAAVLFTSPLSARQQSLTSRSGTCDESAINVESYRLTTEAQALNVLRPREPWWEPYGIWKRPGEIGEINEASVRLAERAKELDDNNLLAHAHLARQYVVLAIDANKAEDEWRRVIESGGAIVWTASLYDVDPRSFFVIAFDGDGIRIFRFSPLAGELRTHFGVPEVPGTDRIEFWRALGGCIPADTPVEAEIPWSNVREIRVTPFSLRFELHDRVTVTSDRGRRRTDDTLEMNLHPHTALADFRLGMTPFGRGPFGPPPPVSANPAAFHQRVKQLIRVLQGAPGCIGVLQGALGAARCREASQSLKR